MNQDTHVYCTHCKHLLYCDENLPYCPWSNECDNWNFEDSKPFSERPHYEDRVVCDYHQILKDDAKIFSDIAEISAEESTKILQEVMKTYGYDVNELNEVVDKLNEVGTGYPIPVDEIKKIVGKANDEYYKDLEFDYMAHMDIR